jgi:hemolysin III
VGICFGLIGGAAIIILSVKHSAIILTAVSIYAVALAAMLTISGAYNMWPVCDTKWIFRRFDHSAIYLLIAGTYTPLIAQLRNGLPSLILLAALWLSAGIGIMLKLMLPGRFDRLAIALYLVLGWCGVVAYSTFFALLPSLTFHLLAAGGILYSVGVIFHVSRAMRFQNAIWHAFVLLGAACHYAAILQYVALA